MYLKLVVLILCTVALYDGAYGALSGTFKWGKHNCKWTELRKPGGGPRAMTVNCKNLPVNCQFKGNPHSCAWYNNNHQKQFYQKLADQLGADANVNPCNHGSVCYAKKCPDVTFNKVGSSALWEILADGQLFDDDASSEVEEFFFDEY